MHSSGMHTDHSSSHLLGGVCLSACWDTAPFVWVWRPPGHGHGDPPGVGPGDPPGQTPQAPPWMWAWKPARHDGIHPPGDLQGMLGYHPPM